MDPLGKLPFFGLLTSSPVADGEHLAAFKVPRVLLLGPSLAYMFVQCQREYKELRSFSVHPKK